MSRLKLRSVALAGLLAAAVIAGCGGGGDSTSSAETEGEASAVAPPESIADSGTMTVCADLSFPPMTYEDEGQQPAGFDVETARNVADVWGVEFALQNMPFEGVLPALSTGRCDFAWTGINVTDERLETFDAVPYLKTAEVLVVPTGNPGNVDGPQDLSGLTVATQGGTIYAEQLESIANDLRQEGKAPPTIQTYPKMSEAIQQIIVGRADAVLTQDTEAAYRSTQDPGSFEIAYTFPNALEFGVYFKQGEAEVKRSLEAALAELVEDGELAEAAESNGLSPENLVVG